MPRKGKTRLRRPNVLPIVVTDRELRIRPLLVTVLHHAYIAATKYRPLVRIVCYCKLGQIERELLPHVQGEDERFHGFVSRPLFLGRTPGYRRVPSNNLPELGLHQSQSSSLPIAFLVELLDGKVVLAGPEHQLERTYLGIKQPLDGRHVCYDLACDLGRSHPGLDYGRRYPFPPRSRFEVEVARLVQKIRNLLLQGRHLILQNSGDLYVLGRVHLVEDGTEVVAVDLRVAVLSNIFDKFHNLDAEAVGLDPHPEFSVLGFDPFDEG